MKHVVALLPQSVRVGSRLTYVTVATRVKSSVAQFPWFPESGCAWNVVAALALVAALAVPGRARPTADAPKIAIPATAALVRADSPRDAVIGVCPSVQRICFLLGYGGHGGSPRAGLPRPYIRRERYGHECYRNRSEFDICAIPTAAPGLRARRCSGLAVAPGSGTRRGQPLGGGDPLVGGGQRHPDVPSPRGPVELARGDQD